MLYCVTEFSNAEIADLIWKVQLLNFVSRDETLPIRPSIKRSLNSLAWGATENFHDKESGGFVAAPPARLLITASSSAGSTGFAK